MTDEWFRSRAWSADIASAFDARLKRARRKAQYLRIQACTLAASYPEVALELLDRYFELDDNFAHAQAYVDRASALRALGRTDDAMDAYEHALTREAVFANLLTNAYLELPLLIGVAACSARYDRALDLLVAHKQRLTFPVDHFKWHAAHALIKAHRGDLLTARQAAREALDAATRTSSGLRFHPEVGLVDDQYQAVLSRLAELSNS